MKKKMCCCCAGIVTYNPEIERFGKVVGSIASQLDSILIVDNGSLNIDDIASTVEKYSNAVLIRLSENKGIAAALNIVCHRAMANGFDYVITLDQDTIVDSGLVSELMGNVGDKIGIVCPRVQYEGNERFDTMPNRAIEDVDWAITSGSLTSINAWNSVLGFDEKMFIDGVDKDFCLRIRKTGWRVVRVNTTVMHHRLGDLHCKKLFGKTIYVTNHPAFRRYYMARNHVYLNRKGLTKKRDTIPWLIKESSKILLFEKQVVPKIAALIKGAIDGRSIAIAS